MPSLNTLRTKGGVIVTIVIFLALLVFILSDVSGLFGTRKMSVGEIDGKDVDYVEFYNTSEYVNNIYKMMWGRDALSSQEQEMLYNEAWNQMLLSYSYKPGFEKLGIGVGNDEQVDMLDGVYLSPIITQTFANPQTGMFDSQLMKMFLQNANTDANANAIWNFLKNQMGDERAMSKYLALVGQGLFVNDLDVADGMNLSANKYDAQVVSRSYLSIADSLVTVSSNDIRTYYNAHKNKFKRSGSRDVEYVVFDVLPSATDYAEAEKEINKIAGEFRTVETPMQYATLNSQTKPDNRYFKESDLTPDLAKITFGRDAGSLFGPELRGDTYTVSRMADIKMVPDTIGFKYIMLGKSEKALADSLVTVIRRGGDFASLAQQYSQDESVIQNGGDMGRFAPDDIIPEFSSVLVNTNVGQVLTIETPVSCNVVQLTYKARPVRKAQIATITYKVDPSPATMQAAYQRASNLITAANGTAEGFRTAASNEGLPKRNAHILNTERNISGFTNSRELVRWAFNNKQGDVSSIMEIDGDYVVATLAKVSEAGYAPIEEVTADIRSTLRKEAKGRMLAEQMKGKTPEEIAVEFNTEIKEAKDIDPAGFFIPSVGMEPKLLGAVTHVKDATISKPVTGNTGVYVFFTTNKTAQNDGLTAEDEKIRLEANNSYQVANRAMQALTQESNVQDMRVKFF